MKKRSGGSAPTPCTVRKTCTVPKLVGYHPARMWLDVTGPVFGLGSPMYAGKDPVMRCDRDIARRRAMIEGPFCGHGHREERNPSDWLGKGPRAAHDGDGNKHEALGLSWLLHSSSYTAYVSAGRQLGLSRRSAGCGARQGESDHENPPLLYFQKEQMKYNPRMDFVFPVCTALYCSKLRGFPLRRRRLPAERQIREPSRNAD
jgi:hypothetical protein